jgi:hypothetical protein
MRRDDLFTKLHDQYNTIPSSIQDPEAFHHDVYELSNKASSADEFHRLMADRKEQRIRELNDLLESASVEIIANPNLIGTAQWQYALQLFRTKSLDSLVRYFASYLPDDHPWHHSDLSSSESEEPESIVTSQSSSFFEDKPIISEEPFTLPTTTAPIELPPSPRSMTVCSDLSEDVVHHHYVFQTLTPARTLSFSEADSDDFGLKLKDSLPPLHDDTASQPSDPATPISSVGDLLETHHDFVTIDADDLVDSSDVSAHDEYPSTKTPHPNSMMESETPTPKPEAPAACFFDSRLSPVSSALRQRSLSPSRRHHPLIHATHNDCRKSQRIYRRDLESSPVRRSLRRRQRRAAATGLTHDEKSEREDQVEPTGRIQRPLPAPIRSRPRERQRVDRR